MRKVIFGALLCALLTMFGCGPAEWVDFESDEGEFAVLMPAQPKIQSQTVQTTAGPIKIVVFMHDAGIKAYMVAFNEIPEAVFDQKTPEKMMSDGIKKAMANIRGRKKSEKSIKLDGYEGKEITFSIPSSGKLPGGGKGKARIYLVGNRFYQVLALGKKSVPEVDFDKFLDSFELYE